MNPVFYVRQARREMRGARGRLLFFVLCLAVGVAAVTAVAGLSGAVEGTIRAEARQLLGADLAVESRSPLPPALDEALRAESGLERADLREMVTVVAAAGDAGAATGGAAPPSQLVELKVVSGGYPFYGRLDLEPTPEGATLAEWLGSDGVVAGPDLLRRFDLSIGDTVRLGGADFVLRGVVRREPDSLGASGDSFAAGPRVFLGMAGLERTVLEGRGSRVQYRALLRLGEGAAGSSSAVTSLANRLRQRLDAASAADPSAAAVRVETYAEAQPSLRRGLRRAERFLGLVALLSLLVGGVGVGQTVRAWLASRLDAVAVLKCLGMRRRQIFLLFAAQALALGSIGSLCGVLAGLAVQWSVPLFLGDLVPAAVVRRIDPGALARGLALGTGVALAFSLAPLAAAVGVPALRVLRRDAEPLPPARATRAALFVVLLLLLWGLAAAQADSRRLGALFVATVTGAAGILALGASGLLRVLSAARSLTLPLWLRHGIAAMLRPAAGVRAAIVALGLGALVTVAMWQVETQLADRLERELPVNAPSAFLIDVQREQWPRIRATLTDVGAQSIAAVPVISARMLAIDGRTVAELASGTSEDRSRRWALTREQRLTYLESLPADNRIVAGALWSDAARAEVSVEEEFARDLGVGLGSVVRFDVQGVPLDLAITSLRSVDWETFGINFFLVVEPGVLEDAPQSIVAAARFPPGGEQRAQDLLARDHPNVTMIRIRDVLDRIVTVLRRIGTGVRFLGAFTAFAALAIFAGAVAAGAARRGREAALLKTIGMTRAGVASVFATEYALIGAVSGALGSAAGVFLAWGVLTRGMEAPWRLDLVSPAVAAAGATALAVAAGLLAGYRALAARPIEVLRRE